MTHQRQKRRVKKERDSALEAQSAAASATNRSRRAKTRKSFNVLPEQRAFSANLVRLRLAAGLTQDELASKSGVSQSNISALENTTWEPRLSTIFALAKAFGVAPAELVFGWDRT